MQDARGFYTAFSVVIEQLETENEVNGEYSVHLLYLLYLYIVICFTSELFQAFGLPYNWDQFCTLVD